MKIKRIYLLEVSQSSGNHVKSFDSSKHKIELTPDNQLFIVDGLYVIPMHSVKEFIIESVTPNKTKVVQ